ncbi:MAG: UDP-N-acetylmuramate--L-alanine ligase [Gammaproteobacteria bacterium]|nr:UDP-N-acetylmuramate--L-alanine ligase [Gammaproteobacteria bacterium]MCH9762707.1 UDP-N-acetylmuramate--L-alanine ligase [Gammaproteobacteria bacterium]
MSESQSFLSPRMGRVKSIHFVGIGGTGMCGIAEVLHNEGYHVTGSDMSENRAVSHLQSLGVQVSIGHVSDNIKAVDVVVRSTAIHEDNPEVVAARAARIPVIPRAMMLAELMRFRQGIAIAGTHGKTTTTSLVSSLLAEGGLDPSFVIGGKLTSIGSNANLGHSPYFVAEADESDASFLFLKPTMAVVTNIDEDHMDTYEGNFDKLRATFVEFLHHLPFYGLAVICVDDAEARAILPSIQRPTLTYGFSDDAEYRASDWNQDGLISSFTVTRPKPHASLRLALNLPGRHNVLNAMAAVVLATELGVKDEAIVTGLSEFQGVGRRFQLLGERQFSQGKALVVDDYGHHPEEIRATVDAFRAVWPNRRLLHVFQPHRYSRTQALFSQFVEVLSLVDELFLLDIYSAGEPMIDGISSMALAKAVDERVGGAVNLVTDDNVMEHLDKIAQEGDVILLQGAGNIGQLAAQFVAGPGEIK